MTNENWSEIFCKHGKQWEQSTLKDWIKCSASYSKKVVKYNKYLKKGITAKE